MIEYIKDNIVLFLIILVLLVAFIISLVIILKSHKKKIGVLQDNLDQAYNAKNSEPTPNQLMSRLQEENRRLLKANDELMKSNQELSAGTSNSADYSRFKNEVDDLKNKISRMQIHEEELEKELKEKKDLLMTYQTTDIEEMKQQYDIMITSSNETIEENISEINKLKQENTNLQLEIQRLNDLLDDESREVVCIEKEQNENADIKKILDTVSKFDKKLDIAVSTKPGKTLKELESLSRQELFAIAKQLQFKGYNKLTNKEIAGLIYGKVNS